ncbi:hypothetical protein GW924_01735 [Candidatus Pacearchaeota archaeon]|nr:hypothetical protein [Candidatus Pacearchaeota archaeon]
MNKKGDTAVLVFIFLVIVVLLGTIFSFLTTSGKVEAEIQNSNYLDAAYAKENEVEFYLYESLRKGVVEEYYRMSLDNSFFGGNPDMRNGKLVLGEYNDNAGRFSNSVSSRMKKTNIENDIVMERFDREIELKTFTFNYSDMSLEMEGFPFIIDVVDGEILWKEVPDELEKDIGVIYRPELKARLNLTEIGLHDFSYIYDSAIFCQLDEMCLKEKLFNFDVKITSGEEGDLVRIESKKEFLLDGNFRRIVLEFYQ